MSETACRCPDGAWLYAACSALGKRKGAVLRRDLSLLHYADCEGRGIPLTGDWSPDWLRRCYRRGRTTLRTLGWKQFDEAVPG